MIAFADTFQPFDKGFFLDFFYAKAAASCLFKSITSIFALIAALC
jgi:hypothetical protein